MPDKPITILGVSCFYHDAAAALVRDGQLIAAASEERFTRKKHTQDFPIESINYCLKEAGIEAKDLDYIVFYEKPFRKFERILRTYIASFPWSFDAFRTALPMWLKEKLRVGDIIKDKLGYTGEVLYSDHHMSHAASTFLISPYEEAAILTVDGVGEWSTTTYGVGRGNKIEIFKEIQFPHSLGLLYSAFTGYLGFKVNEGEGKVMGLAPYGKPVYKDKLDKLISVREDGSFRLDMKYFKYTWSRSHMFNQAFCDLLGAPARIPDSEMTQHYMDVAASLQAKLEEVEIQIAMHLHKVTGLSNLCIAGGVGLNSVANWQIRQNTPFKNIFIQPGSGDDGAAIGAAFYVWNCLLDKPRGFVMTHAFWGPGYSNDEIKKYLDEKSIRYEQLTDEQLVERTAQLIAEDKVVGWFHGRMEVGPRALGSRSILGNPANLEMKDILNRKVKHREAFRPFAPTVAAEDSERYFDMDCPSPFMLLIGDVREEWKDKLPAITHVDGTARVQTVTKADNGLYYDLCRKVGEKTGVAMVIDTSFNIAGEPIVCSPHDAFLCYATTGIDRLVMGNFLLDAKNEKEFARATDIEARRMDAFKKKKDAANEKMRRNQQLSPAKKLFFSLFACFLLLLFGEAALRVRERSKYGIWTTDRMLHKNDPELIYRLHPYLNASLAPGVTQSDDHAIRNPETGEKEKTVTYTIHVNSLGFRGKDFTAEKPEGVYRIACLGGSTTFGVGCTNDDTTWPAILETMLNERHPGRRFEVVNAGVAGYTSVESFINYSLRVSRLQPDLVLVYHGYNDLKPNRYKEKEGVVFQPDYSHWKAAINPRFQTHQPLLRSLLQHSMLFLKLENNLYSLMSGMRKKRVAESDEGKFDTVSEEGVLAYKSHIRAIAALAQSDGADVILGTFATCLNEAQSDEERRDRARDTLPFLPNLSINGYLDGLARHNAAVGEVSDELHTGLVDLATLMPKDRKYYVEHDDIHFVDAGNQKMAELWLTAVEQRLHLNK